VLTAKIRSREHLSTRGVWLFVPWTLAEILCAIICAVVAARGDVVPYDIVYVRQPRCGDTINTTWPEVAHPAKIEPDADLMLLHPDGSEELPTAALSSAAAPAVVLGNGRDSRRRFARVPIWLHGAAATAVELRLQYDPRQPRLRRVRTVDGARGAALACTEPAAGGVHLARASAHALASDRRPILTVVFEKLTRHGPLGARITQATVDEQTATIAP